MACFCMTFWLRSSDVLPVEIHDRITCKAIISRFTEMRLYGRVQRNPYRDGFFSGLDFKKAALAIEPARGLSAHGVMVELIDAGSKRNEPFREIAEIQLSFLFLDVFIPTACISGPAFDGYPFILRLFLVTGECYRADVIIRFGFSFPWKYEEDWFYQADVLHDLVDPFA